jgi:hypothetical protein
MLSQSDEWLIADTLECESKYVVHTLTPRFIGEIRYSLDVPRGCEVSEIEWIDPQPLDEATLARLVREANAAIYKHHLCPDV